MTDARPAWQKQKERSNVFWVSLLAKIALILGRPFIKILLHPIVSYFYLSSSAARKQAKTSLSQFMQRPATPRDVYRNFYKFAMCSVDRFFVLTNKHRDIKVRVHNKAVFTPLVEANKGAILLVSHVGSFDVMRILGDQHKPFDIDILMDTEHNATAFKLISSLNPKLAEHVINSHQSAPLLALLLDEKLQQGNMIGIMADRSQANEKTQVVNFAGRPAAFPTSPWHLANVLKVPVILCTSLLRDDLTYDIYFEKMADGEAIKRHERASMTQKMIAHYADTLAAHIQQSPDNWFNFYPFWHDE